MLGLTTTPSPVNGTAWWIEDFRAFTWQHLAIALFGAGLAAGLTLAGVVARRRGVERPVRWSFAGLVVLVQTVTTVYWLLPRNFDLDISLPLHLCDVVAWLAPLTLVIQARWMRSALYFWGIGLSTQAFFTPILAEGAGSLRFWLFWVGHAMILGSALYDVVVLRFRPRGRDFLTAAWLSVGYVGAMMAFNVAFDTNYGYVGDQLPGSGTVLDMLGPWPWRVLGMVALGLSLLAALWLIWPLAGRLRGRGAPAKSETTSL